MLLNETAYTEETSKQFPQYALLHSVTCVQLRLITVLGNCGCVAVARFLGVPWPKSKMKLHSSESLSFHSVIQTDYAEAKDFVEKHFR
jgi:hypothetical protein